MKRQCTHEFIATSKKGMMTVKIKTTNIRAKNRNERLSTTYFKCSKCGAIKEYPDTWEKNYISCDQQNEDG